MKLRTALVAGLCLAMTSAAFAQRNRQQLKVGDAAPGLDIEKWVQGEEVSLKNGHAYIIEFWATWCVPCKESIPHLSELQEKYKGGVTIVGVSTDEDTSLVEPFVKSMGQKMSYTVAIDRRKSTQRAWMDAAGLEGIPAAIVVDTNGRIAWIGNPHPRADGAELESVLAKIVTGRFDPRLQRQAEPTIRAARSARKMRNWRMATRHYDEVIEVNPQVFAEIALERFEMLMLDMNQKDEAYAYAQDELIGKHFVADAEALQWLALRIVLDSKIADEDRDLDIALEAAEQARDLLGMNSPEGMALVAQIHFHRGEITEAVELQRRAYFMARPDHKERYERVLTTYQQNARRTSSSRGDG